MTNTQNIHNNNVVNFQSNVSEITGPIDLSDKPVTEQPAQGKTYSSLAEALKDGDIQPGTCKTGDIIIRLEETDGGIKITQSITFPDRPTLITAYAVNRVANMFGNFMAANSNLTPVASKAETDAINSIMNGASEAKAKADDEQHG